MEGARDDVPASPLPPAAPAVAEPSAPAGAGARLSPEDLAWEERPCATLSRDGGTPMLQVESIEGPLDWLLEQARAGRVDLARLPVLALVEQCTAAVAAALASPRAAGGDGEAPASLQRLGEWLIMAAWLVRLRSRLLLPADDPDARAAREEAEALRRQLADRERVRAMAASLDGLPQLGRDVFARFGAIPPAPAAPIERIAGLAAFLRTCARLMGPAPQQAAADVYRLRPPLLWRVPDALARIRRLLPAVLAAAPPEGAGLWCFLPAPEDLDAALAAAPPGTTAVRAVLGRSAVASTFVAGLELARQRQLALMQDEAFASIRARDTSATP